ncbi:hypothetical protein MLD38_023327 [Melastoma candidum]|uniref:Uncharacterized protein n=1 Tax=Melastoma candidum TaxID=119954 RepID=A0ACB9QND1_9MYRT|nr:hypothetical protein MLD38_023327 [Melastoma candidum]
MQRQSGMSGQLPETNDNNMGSLYNGSDINQHHPVSNRSYGEGNRVSNYGESSSASGGADAHGAEGFLAWSSSHPASGSADAHGVDGFVSWSRRHQNSNLNSEDQDSADGTKDQNVVAYSNFGGSRAEPPSVLPSIIRRSSPVTPGPAGFQTSMTSSSSRPADVNGINSIESRSSGPLELLRSSSANYGHMDNMTGGSSSSSGTWGFSCKRRAFEGTSQQSLPSSSRSGGNAPAESPAWLGSHDPNTSPGAMSLSPPSSWQSPSSSYLEPRNLRSETARRDIGFEPFPSTRAPGNGENAQRVFSRRMELESIPQQEPVPFLVTSERTYRRPHSFALHQPYRPSPYSDGLNLRSALGVGSVGSFPAVSNVLNGPEVSGDMLAFPWNDSSQSRSGNPSSSFLSRAVGSVAREDLHLRNNGRSNPEVPMFTSANDARSTVMPMGQSFNVQPSPSTWGSSQTRNPIQQQLLEVAPWSFFPTNNAVAGRQNTTLPSLSSGPSSALATTISNGGHAHSHPMRSRRSGLSMDIQDDDGDAYMSDYLRNLPSDDVRTRLLSEIRQVLDALHRGERLPIEEFLVFEPFVHHGLAELHDRHRDMRLDVDNMSYEELLALEERIGDVNTGLSEETILKCMQQKKRLGSDIAETMQEPCCICQEEYTDGDDLGILECGHEFHVECIKQWLAQKNLCPICKTTGLVT